MNNNKSLLLKISVIMNTVLAFFGSYIGNLYIIQIIALIPAFLAVPLKEIKIKKDTEMWLIVVVIFFLSAVISNNKIASVEIVCMIAMAVMLKIIYENSDIKLSKFFINFVEMASCIHVIATIMQLINPGFIQNINTSILGSAGIKTNLELLKVGSYAGITAQTAVNAYYITIFICIKFSKILTEKRYKVINVMWLLVAIIALFLTGKRGMVICIIISSSILYLYKMRSNYKKIVKNIVIALIFIAFFYIIIINVPEAKVLIDKTSQLEKNNDILNGRSYLWSETIKIFKCYPIMGIEIGSIKDILGDYSHNVYIQLLAETGIIGFLSYAIAITTSLLMSIKKLKNALKGKNKMVMEILGFSILMQIIFIIYSITGNPLYGHIFLIPYIISTAMHNQKNIE